MEHTNQERKSYDPPAVVYETELEVHAASSTSSGSPDSIFDLLSSGQKVDATAGCRRRLA